MPQFDLLLIFSLLKDLTLTLIFYYLTFSILFVQNITTFKFRTKILKTQNSILLKAIITANKLLFKTI